MRYLLHLGGLLSVLALAVYLYKLAARTDYFDRTASVGNDVVVIVALVCLVSLLSSTFAVRLHVWPQWLAIATLASSILLSVTYLILFAANKFGLFVKS